MLETQYTGFNPALVKRNVEKDYFVDEGGLAFAGTHLIVDLWEGSYLSEKEKIEAALWESAKACGAKVLHSHLHRFNENNGISGVLVLAESHISIHTWPEKRFAALDIFMCGKARPTLAIPVLEQIFQPSIIEVKTITRGIIHKEGE